jgi:hypothetical protein
VTLSPMVRQVHHDVNVVKTLDLILSLSKDEAKISHIFRKLLRPLRKLHHEMG